MKVKFFSSLSLGELEKEINAFLGEDLVGTTKEGVSIDLKINQMKDYHPNGNFYNQWIDYTAIVTYKIV